MKGIITTTFIILAISATGQTTTTPTAAPASVQLNYRMDFIRPDSFYLVEIKETISETGKRGKVEEEALLLRDTSEIHKIILYAEAQQADLLKKVADFHRMQESLIKILATLNERKPNQPSQGQRP